MKLIKLNQRHNLGRRGFKYAFVFTRYGPDVPSEFKVEHLVRQAEGMGIFYGNTFYGKRSSEGSRTPYYIGFNQESTATLVQLQL